MVRFGAPSVENSLLIHRLHEDWAIGLDCVQHGRRQIRLLVGEERSAVERSDEKPIFGCLFRLVVDTLLNNLPEAFEIKRSVVEIAGEECSSALDHVKVRTERMVS
jgi:hypothetical protein